MRMMREKAIRKYKAWSPPADISLEKGHKNSIFLYQVSIVSLAEPNMRLCKL